MKQTIDNRGFHRAFEDHGRGGQYSADALDALFEYFEEFESLTGEEIELDVIAICGDWVEYADAIEAYNELLGKYDDVSGEDAIVALQKQTTIIELDDSVLIQNF